MKQTSGLLLAALAIGFGLLLAGCNEERITSKQEGRRGLGLVQSEYTSAIAVVAAANKLPDVPEVIYPVDKSGVPASQSKAYQNVQALGDIDENELPRLMAAITEWVAPQQGCVYCHNPENLASDELYTKRVARRMIQMVRHINVDWTKHVAQTGVTCYTCHRGNPVPQYIWYSGPTDEASGLLAYNPWAKMHPGPFVAGAALPNDPFSSLLDHDNQVRVVSTSALPTPHEQLGTIKNTEVTYALMLNMSKGLGVNCTFCHNTRAFYDWSQSAPQRTTAWYGIRMVRDINGNYLDPLKAILPPYRLGAEGDPPKLFCMTCHQGVNKPLKGVSMLKDWPELTTLGVVAKQ